MAGRELAVELLQMATSDLKALENMLDSEVFDDRIFGFHAQQAVEKLLKAWLNCTGRTHPFTHDLGVLLHALEEQGADVEAWWSLVDLNSYAVRFRYEMLPLGEEPLERQTLLDDVRALCGYVKKLVACD